MKFYCHQPIAVREAGFINSEGAILGGILLVLAAVIFPIGNHIQSNALLAVGIFVGVLGLICFSLRTFEILRYRRRLKKKPKQD